MLLYTEDGAKMSAKYISDVPELLSEWDVDKNSGIGLSANKLTLGSNKDVYWKCSVGHEWTEAVYHRAKGKPCPYCAGKRVKVGYNDLATLYPQLSAEWDEQKNVGININSVVQGSTKKVWWKCTVCGNSWQAKVCDRTSKKTGCPRCALSKRSESRHLSSLAENGCLTDTKLLSEWDYEKNYPVSPSDVTTHSNKYAWWKCSKCGYSWRAKISNRSSLGRGCPLCANAVVIEGKNDLATTNPILAAEWHPTKNAKRPTEVSAGCGKKVWWLCPKGHEYQATVLHRSYGTNCPICNAGRQTSFAEQAFFYYIKQAYPDAISRYNDIFDNGMELDIFIPSVRLAIEYDGVYWHRDEKTKRDAEKYQICKENNIKLIRIRESDGSTWGIADEAFHIDDLDNRENLEILIRIVLDAVDPRTNKWTRTKPIFHSPVDINLRRDECKIRGYMTEVKNSLQNLRPDLALEWHPTRNGNLKPNMFKTGSDFKAWWKCRKCGCEWQTTIGHRVSGTGCPVCYRENNKIHHPLAKKVYQYSKEGKFIKEWNSIAEAGRELSINHSNISMCIKGKRKVAGGFVWKED